MQPDVLALLAAIKDTPADDTPRLVLADWLEEHGRDDSERARGELMRVQCQLARLAANDPARTALLARGQQLLREHLPAWLEGLPPRLTDSRTENRGCTVERGLLRLWFTPQQRWLNEHPGDNPAWAWVDGLVLLDHPIDDVALLTFSSVLEQLNYLNLGPNGWSGWTNDQPIGSEGALVLVSSRRITRLTHLDLSDCVIGPDGAAAIAQSPHLRRLTHLDLGGADCTPANFIRDAGVQALAGSAHLSSLTFLNLMENGITAAGARAIAESPHLGELTHLYLNGNPVGPEGARALAGSPGLTRLTSLGLEVSNHEYSSANVQANEQELEAARVLLRQRFGSAWRE